MINFVIQNYNPNILLFSGDMADGSNSSNMLSYHMQYQQNWDEVNKSLIEAKVFELNATKIFLAGNHDMFGISKDDMESNKFRKMFYNESTDWEFQKYQLQAGKKLLNIVCFNPVRPPSGSSPLGIFPYVRRKLLNKLEANYDENAYNIIVNHFPRRFLWSSKSATGKSIKDITNMYDVMLTGHRHPRYNVITTIDGLLHVISPALAWGGRNFNILTIDNGHFIAHTIINSSDNQALITYPVPKDQITPKTIFSVNEFDVKVLFYGNDYSNLSLMIDDNTTQPLE